MDSVVLAVSMATAVATPLFAIVTPVVSTTIVPTLALVLGRPDEVHRPATSVISRAMLRPFARMARRHVEVNRIMASA